MGKQLRRAENDLILSGKGAIVLGAWYFLKVFLYRFFAEQYIIDLIGDAVPGPQSVGVFYIEWGVSMFLLLLLRLHIGRRAIREGRDGIHGGKLYPVLAGLLCLAAAADLCVTVFGAAMGGSTLPAILSDIILDTVGIYNLFGLIRAVIQVRRLRARNGKEAAEHAA